jgi:hypothetical protein
MNESCKPWYLSKGVLGPLATGILVVLRCLGVADVDQDEVFGLLYGSAEIAGLLVGIIGRVLAQKRVTLGVSVHPGAPVPLDNPLRPELHTQASATDPSTRATADLQ